MSCQTFIDVGVAGLHRLFSEIEEINKYDVLIVCAGMEGALATVVGGLLPQPIIAVPVSVGYGVSKNGETALNSMLSSCACLLYTSPSPRDLSTSRMPSSA